MLAVKAEAAETAPAPESFVGRRVRKEFADGFYDGIVDSTRLLGGGATRVWRVRYADGDSEDVEWPELAATLQPCGAAHAGAGARAASPQPKRAGPAARPAGPAYKGVSWSASAGGFWQVTLWDTVSKRTLSLHQRFAADAAADAARAYDDAMRARGGTDVNFPRPGSAETQAAFGPQAYMQRSPPAATAAAAHAVPAAASEHAPGSAQRYKGVSWHAGQWRARFDGASATQVLGLFPADQAAAAARAYDAAVRAAGGTAVNFPQPGTAETQACRNPRAPERTPPAAAGPAGAHAGSPAAVKLERAAAAAVPMPAGAQRYKGVKWQRGRWHAVEHYTVKSGTQKRKSSVDLGSFPPHEAAAAARAYDAAVRARGGTDVNFPRPGGGETQARFKDNATAGKRLSTGAAGRRKRKRAACSDSDSSSSDGGDGDDLEAAEEPPASHSGGAAAQRATPPGAAPRIASHRAAQPPPPPPLAVALLPLTLDAFICGVQPPLSAPAAVLARLRAGGVTLAHLRALGALYRDERVSKAAVECTTCAVLACCGALPPPDALALRISLAQLPGLAQR